MRDRVEALSGLGPRVAGTEASTRAGDIVADELRRAGAAVTVAPISYQGWEYGEAPSVAMTVPEHREVEAAPMAFAPASHGAIEGPVSLSEEHSTIAGIPFSYALRVAGASQVARLLVAGTELPFPLPAFDDQTVPSVVVGSRDGELIRDLVHRGSPVTASVRTSGRVVTASDVNVIGVLEGDESRTIAVTSHYDSAWRSPGASDNAAGVAIMVELARRVRSYDLENRFEFIAFGAEELGLIGSRRFVEWLAARGRLQQYVGVVNLDPALGSERVLQCEVAPEWLKIAAEDVARDLALPFLAVAPGGAVDSTPFWERGVPVCCPQFLPSPPWFHRPNDVPDRLHWAQLEKVLDFVDRLVQRLACEPPSS